MRRVALFVVLLMIAGLALWTELDPDAIDLTGTRLETATIPTRADVALLPLVAKYGPVRYSKSGEELIIRDFFGDRRGGVFLDVGANHFRINSNTYYLEEQLGWGGIAVDALAEFEEGYRRFRPATRYYTFFVSDRSDERAAFFVIDANNRLSTGSRSLADGYEHDEIEVPTITLDDLLDHAGVERLDLLTMDIELWEPQALAGFDIRRFRPELVCIEAHEPVREQLLDYFAANDYRRLDRYLPFDDDNWYFTPAE